MICLARNHEALFCSDAIVCDASALWRGKIMWSERESSYDLVSRIITELQRSNTVDAKTPCFTIQPIKLFVCLLR